jgi:tetratricopeptide (TPR) repeat protein
MRGMLTGLVMVSILGAQNAAPTFATLSRQADAARDAKQLDKAVSLYRQALKLKPDWDDGLWSLGSITYDLDRYADCDQAFRRLAALKKDSAPAWTMAGLCEYKLRRYDAVLESLSEVERLKFQEPAPLAQAARLHLALVLTKTGSFEKAISVLTALTRADRKTPEIIAAAGIAGLRRPWLPFEVPEADRELVFKLGDAMASAMEFDFTGSIQKFEAVAQQYPSEPNVHFRFGAFLNTQDSDRGVEEIKKALEIAPNHVQALVGLAAIYLKRDDPQNALEYAERAVKASPGDYSTHVVLGRALLAREDPGRAAAELEAAVKLAPASPEARFSLASAYSRLGRKEDAARELAEFKRLQHLSQ